MALGSHYASGQVKELFKNVILNMSFSLAALVIDKHIQLIWIVLSLV